MLVIVLLSRLGLVIVPGLLPALATPAWAGDDTGGWWVQRWLEQPTLTGNWFGLRSKLTELGVTPTITYGTDLLANPVGGLRRSTAYASFGISSKAGYFVIGEALFRLNGEAGGTGLPGRYRAGGYYDSNLYTSFANPAHQQRGNYGFFFLGEQMVYREGAPGTDEGLSLFWAVIYAPLQRINTLPYFASVGANYRGLLPSRGKDTAAFAVYYGGFSRDLPGQTYELVLEWTYALAVAPWLTVQPDVQYIVNPGGRSSIGNALVVGAQLLVQF